MLEDVAPRVDVHGGEGIVENGLGVWGFKVEGLGLRPGSVGAFRFSGLGFRV